MNLSAKNLGFGALILITLILAFSPVDDIKVEKVTTDDLIHQLHNQSNYIEAEEVAHMIIDKDPSFQVIDIRSLEDYKKYHIPGSFSIPIESLFSTEASDIMDMEKTIVLASNGNTKAGQAWLLMRSHGYEDLFVLHGGMNHWVNVFSNPKKPKDGAFDDELFTFQFRKSAGPVMMGTNNVVETSDDQIDKPKPIKRKRKKAKKKVDEGC
ncbi:MAG: rhodanese-like domain-containing protein [Calditrichaeota bacterium]|nr:MAG: rhodanese-like domain-containing protein [Calditrichota bacterium]MBL1206387.1 rhodanese-like domain-containing protein [Calditrichota bacterium]NOG46213.1 rhodanese-like domain-containing protein [Calditrichota bacterium]